MDLIDMIASRLAVSPEAFRFFTFTLRFYPNSSAKIQIQCKSISDQKLNDDMGVADLEMNHHNHHPVTILMTSCSNVL